MEKLNEIYGHYITEITQCFLNIKLNLLQLHNSSRTIRLAWATPRLPKILKWWLRFINKQYSNLSNLCLYRLTTMWICILSLKWYRITQRLNKEQVIHQEGINHSLSINKSLQAFLNNRQRTWIYKTYQPQNYNQGNTPFMWRIFLMNSIVLGILITISKSKNFK